MTPEPLPVSTWRLADLSPEALLDAKGTTTVAVCIPARDEARTVAGVVRPAVALAEAGLVDEVVVVDDGSADDTARRAARAGARVITTEVPEGKGRAMWRSLSATTSEVVAWCDADLRGIDEAFVAGLVGPLLVDPTLVFVKACYERPLDGRPGEGGRVTELVARPLLRLLFPHLAGFHQPLGGEYAGRRRVLETLRFADGYGVDLGLLIDVAATAGVDAMAQVDLGVRHHRNRPLAQLAPQAEAVLAVALDRAGVAPADVVRR